MRTVKRIVLWVERLFRQPPMIFYYLKVALMLLTLLMLIALVVLMWLMPVTRVILLSVSLLLIGVGLAEASWRHLVKWAKDQT